MKRLPAMVLLLACSLASICQSVKKHKLPPMKGDLNCTYKIKYSAAKRLQFYPFSIADTVKIVSFHLHGSQYPVKKDSLLIDSLVEIKTLSKADVNQLTNILYNNFYSRKPNYGMMMNCFLPRNAILFFDKNGNMKESIIVCFHCKNYETSSEKVRLGDDCGQKMEKIRQFFISKDVRLGTDLSVSLYPGESFGDPSVVRPEQTE